jgi:heptosyltransferase-2
MKLLLTQLSFLGDCILSTPVIAGLQAAYPQSELSVLTTPQGGELFAHDPRLKNIFIFDKRGVDKGLGGIRRLAQRLQNEKFDRVYSLHRSARTALTLALAKIPQRIGFSNARLRFLYHECRTRMRGGHEVERNLSLLSGECEQPFNQRLQLFPAATAGQGLGSSPYALLVPGSAWATKRWRIENFQNLAEGLHVRGLEIVVTGTRSERGLGDVIGQKVPIRNLCGELTIQELMEVVRQAKIVVCNDSMSLHMATAFERPVIAVFCATVPEFGFGPWLNPKGRTIGYDALPCRPCQRHGGRVCPTGTELCMQYPTADTVLKMATELCDGA